MPCNILHSEEDVMSIVFIEQKFKQAVIEALRKASAASNSEASKEALGNEIPTLEAMDWGSYGAQTSLFSLARLAGFEPTAVAARISIEATAGQQVEYYSLLAHQLRFAVDTAGSRRWTDVEGVGMLAILQICKKIATQTGQNGALPDSEQASSSIFPHTASGHALRQQLLFEAKRIAGLEA